MYKGFKYPLFAPTCTCYVLHICSPELPLKLCCYFYLTHKTVWGEIIPFAVSARLYMVYFTYKKVCKLNGCHTTCTLILQQQESNFYQYQPDLDFYRWKINMYPDYNNPVKSGIQVYNTYKCFGPCKNHLQFLL